MSESNLIQLEIPANTYIKYYMKKMGYPLKQPCHGRGTCAECLIHVCGGSLPPTLRDIQRLDEKMLQKGYRLGCEAVSITPITIEFNRSQIKSKESSKKHFFKSLFHAD